MRRLAALVAVSLACACSTSDKSGDNNSQQECQPGAVRCNGFNLETCGGSGHWSGINCEASCQQDGYALYGCLDYDGNGIDECVCQPSGSGCADGEVRCDGTNLLTCVGGAWSTTLCDEWCAGSGQEFGGCYDGNGDGWDECVCSPTGTGGSGGGGGAGGSGEDAGVCDGWQQGPPPPVVSTLDGCLLGWRAFDDFSCPAECGFPPHDYSCLGEYNSELAMPPGIGGCVTVYRYLGARGAACCSELKCLRYSGGDYIHCKSHQSKTDYWLCPENKDESLAVWPPKPDCSRAGHGACCTP